MPKMIKELEANPSSGFLGHQMLGLGVLVQYWRSAAQLVAYARDRDKVHYPYWVEFNRKIGSRGDIGIWHETYLVKAGQYEAIYNNMPLFGLAKASKTLDATGAHATARGRLGETDGTDAPISPDGQPR